MPVFIDVEVSDDGMDVIGYIALVPALPWQSNVSRIVARGATKRACAEAAEAAGFDPWMSDEEMDDEAQAMMHGSWLP